MRVRCLGWFILRSQFVCFPIFMLGFPCFCHSCVLAISCIRCDFHLFGVLAAKKVESLSLFCALNVACSSAICIFKNSLFKFTSHTFSFRLPLVCSLASYCGSDGVICAYCLLTCYLLHILSCAPCFPFTVLSLSQVSFQFYMSSHSFPFWLRFFASILFPNYW